jgi:hypothetical protein
MQLLTADFPPGKQLLIALQTGVSNYAFSDFILLSDAQV